MAFEGMDIAEVQTMGRQMQSQADHITNSIVPTLNNLVAKIPGDWRGPDATKFQSWWTEHKTQLLKAANELHGLGQSALNNASAQQAASKA